MVACIRNNNHSNSSENNDNDYTNNNYNKSRWLETRRKRDHKHGLKLTNSILKQIIMIPQPSSPILHTTLPRFRSSKKNCYLNEKHSATLKLERKSKNVGNITSIMGYYPRNG